MRKPLGQIGGAIMKLFLRVAILFSFVSAALSSLNAQTTSPLTVDIYDANFNQPQQLQGWEAIGPDCNAVGNGSWQVTSQPKYGTVTTAIENDYLSCSIDGTA
jgi:hypothetical protein